MIRRSSSTVDRFGAMKTACAGWGTSYNEHISASVHSSASPYRLLVRGLRSGLCVVGIRTKEDGGK